MGGVNALNPYVVHGSAVQRSPRTHCLALPALPALHQLLRSCLTIYLQLLPLWTILKQIQGIILFIVCVFILQYVSLNEENSCCKH